jgi:hypothetical protein
MKLMLSTSLYFKNDFENSPKAPSKITNQSYTLDYRTYCTIRNSLEVLGAIAIGHRRISFFRCLCLTSNKQTNKHKPMMDVFFETGPEGPELED